MQRVVMLPLYEQWGASAWSLDRMHFLYRCEALQKVGVLVDVGGDTDLLPQNSSRAMWLADRWLLEGIQNARLVVFESQYSSCAAMIEPELTWPLPGLDYAMRDVQVSHGLVKRASQATGLLSYGFCPKSYRMSWSTQIGGALFLTVVFMFLGIGFNISRAQQLENEARRLDKASVAAFAQQASDQASLSMLGARLNVATDNESKQQANDIDVFRLLSTKIMNDEQLYLSRLEYDEGKWRLEVVVKKFEDVDTLQSYWQSLGLRGEVSVVPKKTKGLQVRANLERVVEY
ncbi:hypothetical protein [Pseudomonas chlororaphis]|uniref:hypothetical protein n=2 Tax=Pseudomonas TaxID=286 RepID=UPI000F56A2EF|nr:hypothetical protein [Pseudomonas chlororaphis]